MESTPVELAEQGSRRHGKLEAGILILSRITNMIRSKKVEDNRRRGKDAVSELGPPEIPKSTLFEAVENSTSIINRSCSSDLTKSGCYEATNFPAVLSDGRKKPAVCTTVKEPRRLKEGRGRRQGYDDLHPVSA